MALFDEKRYQVVDFERFLNIIMMMRVRNTLESFHIDGDLYLNLVVSL